MIELVAFIGLGGVNYVFSHVSLILVATSILETLFTYLALAKPLSMDSLCHPRAKQMRLNIFVCSDAQLKIKVVISEQHKNILLFLSSTHFYYLFLSLPEIG
jgi:hypothetical protein